MLDIVHHDADVIRRLAVGSKQDEVLDHVAGNGDFANHCIAERHGTFRYFEAHRCPLAVFQPLSCFGGGNVETGPIVFEVGFLRCGFFSLLVQQFGRTEAVVGMTGFEQAEGCRSMLVESCRLHVGTFIPRKPEPFHGFKDSPRHLVAGSFGIGVFDAKHKRAVVLSCIEPVEQCSSGATDVEVSGGGRRKTNANLGLAHLLSFRSAATASRTTSVFGSSVRGADLVGRRLDRRCCRRL